MAFRHGSDVGSRRAVGALVTAHRAVLSLPAVRTSCSVALRCTRATAETEVRRCHRARTSPRLTTAPQARELADAGTAVRAPPRPGRERTQPRPRRGSARQGGGRREGSGHGAAPRPHRRRRLARTSGGLQHARHRGRHWPDEPPRSGHERGRRGLARPASPRHRTRRRTAPGSSSSGARRGCSSRASSPRRPRRACARTRSGSKRS